jgi:hypothetical protein
MRNTFVIKDKDGHIIRKGHNRVVATGRAFLLSAFADKVSPLNASASSDSSYAITKVNFTNSTNATQDSSTMSSDVKAKISITSDNFKKSGNDSITITLKLNANNGIANSSGYAVSCAEMICQAGTVESLFSRFTFDPIYLNPGESDTITYTLRF